MTQDKSVDIGSAEASEDSSVCHVYGLPEKDIARDKDARLCSDPGAPDALVIYHVGAKELSGIWFCEACGDVADLEI